MHKPGINKINQNMQELQFLSILENTKKKFKFYR